MRSHDHGVSHSVGTAHTGRFPQAGPLLMTSVTRLLRVSAVLTLLAGLAAVGLFVSSGAAEAATTDPVAAWTACMKEHGVKLTRPSGPSRPTASASRRGRRRSRRVRRSSRQLRAGSPLRRRPARADSRRRALSPFLLRRRRGPGGRRVARTPIRYGRRRRLWFWSHNLADVAQLVAHHLAKVRVAGSSPVVRSHIGPSCPSSGGVAERRGNGLQSRLHGFKSRLHLH